MNHLTLIKKVMDAGSEKSIQSALRHVDVQTASHVVKYCIEELEERIEMHIQKKETKIAMWNLSKLTYLEDFLMELERSLFHIESLQVVNV